MNNGNNNLEKRFNTSFKTKSIYSIFILFSGLLLGFIAKFADNYFFVGELTTNI